METVIAISGSLRTASLNTTLLKIVGRLLPERKGDRTHAALTLTLEALGTKHISQVTIPAITTKLNEQGELIHPETLQELNGLGKALVTNIRN